MAIVLRRGDPEYIKKTVHRLSIFADVPSLTRPQDIAQALSTWRHALAPVQAETLDAWLETGEATMPNGTVKISVKVLTAVSVTRTGKATLSQAKPDTPGVQIVRRLLAAHKGI